MQSRINKILNDSDFKNHCFRLLNSNPNFEEDFLMCEKIANININGLQANNLLIKLNTPFTPNQIKNGVLGFYNYLDSLTPDQTSLTNVVTENAKYLSYDINGGTKRSYCGTKVLPNGEVKKEIYCNFEGRVSDISNTIHEFCHSLSKSFLHLQPHSDENMREVCTVICDQLSNNYLKGLYPNLNKNFNENELHTQINNVIKARESLLDGIVIKVVTGRLSMAEAQQKYGHLFNNSNILTNCVNNIETFNFSGMYEKRYLVPQAIALEMLEKFKANPKQTAEQFKQVLTHDTDWNVNQTLTYLGLPMQNELIDSYVQKFNTRVAQLKAANVTKK